MLFVTLSCAKKCETVITSLPTHLHETSGARIPCSEIWEAHGLRCLRSQRLLSFCGVDSARSLSEPPSPRGFGIPGPKHGSAAALLQGKSRCLGSVQFARNTLGNCCTDECTPNPSCLQVFPKGQTGERDHDHNMLEVALTSEPKRSAEPANNSCPPDSCSLSCWKFKTLESSS